MRNALTMRVILGILALLSLSCAAQAETMVATLGGAPRGRTFDAKPVFEPRSVLVVGDSLSIYLGERVEDAFKSRSDVSVSRLSKVSSGLAAPSFFNWNEQLQNLASRNKPDLVLIMLGANDNKPLRDAAGRPLAFGGPGWDAEYASRAQKLIDICREHNPNARIFWIGVPVMAKAQFDNEIQHLNEVVRGQCARNAGVFFVNTRDVLADENGDFTKFKTNAVGKDVRVRADDGVHVTPAGAALLAQRSLDSVTANGGAVIHGLPPLKEPIRIAAVAENGEPIKMRPAAPAPQTAKPSAQDSAQNAGPRMRQVKPQTLPVQENAQPELQANNQPAPELTPAPTQVAVQQAKQLPMHRVKPQAEPAQEIASDAAPAPAQSAPLLALASAPEPERRDSTQSITGASIASKPYEIRMKMHQVKPLPERELLLSHQPKTEPAPSTPSLAEVRRPVQAAGKPASQPEAQLAVESDAERAATEMALNASEAVERNAERNGAPIDQKLVQKDKPKTGRVEVATQSERDAASGGYAVQESAWENKALAEKHAQDLQKKGLTARVLTVDLGAKGIWHRVLIGGCENMNLAQALQQDLQQRFNMKNTLIRKLG